MYPHTLKFIYAIFIMLLKQSHNISSKDYLITVNCILRVSLIIKNIESIYLKYKIHRMIKCNMVEE